MKKIASALVHALAGASLVTGIISEAHAQKFPSGSAPVRQAASAAPVQMTSMAAAPKQHHSDFVMLADYTPDGQIPRAARPDNIAKDTPMIDRATFMRKYPQAGAETYELIRQANLDLCNEGVEWMNAILDLKHGFESSADEYEAMERFFKTLPGEIKRGAAIMTLGQAAATGALCLLSGGWYCIAAIATGIANIFSNQVNKKLQLANIKLSLANIRLTKLNIGSNLLTLKFDARWVTMVMPKCVGLFPDMEGLLSAPASAGAKR